MNHQVLEEYNSLNHKRHKQGVTKLMKLLNNYLVMWTFDYDKNYLILI